tara:strand:+ start:160 stop:846 length:687 start_codon:yes stop_codon:yes gene_type:complete
MFFESTPNFLYPDFFEAGKFKLSKNLFRKVRARDSINSIFSSATKYTIKSGQTPDQIAYDLLGDTEHYWTILLINNITDTQTQWPYDDYELDKIIEDRYGDLADKIRHWETKEVKDSYDNIVLESGIIIEVFSNTTAQNASSYTPTWSWTYAYSRSDSAVTERTLTGSDLYPTTNREYEHQLNDLKREIWIPQPSSISMMESEIEELLEYDTEYKITKEGWRESEPVS